MRRLVTASSTEEKDRGWTIIYDEYQAQMPMWVSQHLGPDHPSIDDVIRDGFLVLVEKVEEVGAEWMDGGTVGQFLKTSMRYKALQFIDASRTAASAAPARAESDSTQFESEVDLGFPAPDESLTRLEFTNRLRLPNLTGYPSYVLQEAFDSLRAADQEAIVLDLEGCSLREVADICGISTSSAGSRRSRAWYRFRKKILLI